MSRYKDNSPVPQTCPLIDNVISIVDTIYRYYEAVTIKEKEEIESVMEKIRKANSDLREWGNEMCNEKEELENTLEDKERYINKLETENKELKERVEYLELQNEDLEYDVSKLQDDVKQLLFQIDYQYENI